MFIKNKSFYMHAIKKTGSKIWMSLLLEKKNDEINL